MNTKDIKDAMSWKLTGMVRGVKVRGKMPKEGCAVYYGVGSDSYGYMMKNVSADGSEFDLYDENGRFYSKAKLVTRKNSPIRGCYVQVDAQGRPQTYRSRGHVYGTLGLTDEPGCGKTYLDPSF